jgi:hypothetical protein
VLPTLDEENRRVVPELFECLGVHRRAHRHSLRTPNQSRQLFHEARTT